MIEIILFSIGLYGMTKKNAIKIVFSGEIMLFSAIILLSRTAMQPAALFLILLGALELIIGFGMIFKMHKTYGDVNTDLLGDEQK